jgi:hypothetical protein
MALQGLTDGVPCAPHPSGASQVARSLAAEGRRDG